jgi:hypothetical protein
VCLPRGFDPDYCAYDRYYAIGVALVSAVLGVLADSNVPQMLSGALSLVVDGKLMDLCGIPHGSRSGFSRQSMNDASDLKSDAEKSAFHSLCVTLSNANGRITDGQKPFKHELDAQDAFYRSLCVPVPEDEKSWIYWLTAYPEYKCPYRDFPEEMWDLAMRRGVTTPFRLELIVRNIIRLVMLPGSLVGTLVNAGRDDRLYNPSLNDQELVQDMLPSTAPYVPHEDIHEVKKDKLLHPNWLYVSAMAAWTLKHVSRYMNEHALMIASFFRTNARRLSAGQEPMLDLVAFARQCREDIVDGANPPPPPPPSYEDFNPAAVAAERRREDARERAEERDLLMPGVDYPPPIDASAAGKGGA